jgi:hypothetical protein
VATSALLRDLLVVQSLPAVLEYLLPALSQRGAPSRAAFYFTVGEHVCEVGVADTSTKVLEGSFVPALVVSLSDPDASVREAAQGALAAVHGHMPPGVLTGMLEARGVPPAQIAEVERRFESLEDAAAPAVGSTAARQCVFLSFFRFVSLTSFLQRKTSYSYQTLLTLQARIGTHSPPPSWPHSTANAISLLHKDIDVSIHLRRWFVFNVRRASLSICPCI